jgi:hypothetical protein
MSHRSNRSRVGRVGGGQRWYGQRSGSWRVVGGWYAGGTRWRTHGTRQTAQRRMPHTCARATLERTTDGTRARSHGSTHAHCHGITHRMDDGSSHNWTDVEVSKDARAREGRATHNSEMVGCAEKIGRSRWWFRMRWNMNNNR